MNFLKLSTGVLLFLLVFQQPGICQGPNRAQLPSDGSLTKPVDDDEKRKEIELLSSQASAAWMGVYVAAIGLGFAVIAAGGAAFSVYYARRTLQSQLRPRLRAMQFAFQIEEGNHSGHFLISNEGGQPAEIDTISYAVLLYEGVLPQIHPTRHDTRNMWERKTSDRHREYSDKIKAGDVREIAVFSTQPLTTTEVQEIRSGKKDFYIVGWIAYKGTLSNVYWTQFCRKYDRSKYRFEVAYNKDWEYQS